MNDRTMNIRCAFGEQNGLRELRGPCVRTILCGLLVLPLCVLCVTGCVSFDPEDARREQTESFTNDLARLEAEWLAAPLSLDDCLRIAMTNNYEIRKADLDAKLGRFSRDMAFSAFLPLVSAPATRIDYDKNPVLNSQRFTSGGVDVGLALLMPSTWFLYDEARHGRAAAELAAGYVRQGVALQTTSAYYDVVVQERLVAAHERQLAAARETADRVAGLEREGLARPWERDQAALRAETREAELGAARRRLVRERPGRRTPGARRVEGHAPRHAEGAEKTHAEAAEAAEFRFFTLHFFPLPSSFFTSSLFTLPSSLPTVRCSLFAVRCSLFVVSC